MNAHEFKQMLDNFKEELLNREWKPLGCGSNDLLSLKKQYGEFPKYYELFLLSLGVNGGDFKEGTAIFYEDLKDDLTTETINLMLDNNVIPPKNMFTFLLHQGYSALFFTDRVTPDPVIYCYTEGKSIIQVGTFSGYLKEEIDDYLSSYKKLNDI